MHPPTDPTCLIARHEAGMVDECRSIMSRMDAGHRSEEFNRLILPLCQPLVEAIGHRMAYEAAVKTNVHRDLLALYEVGIINQDPSWYVEHAGLSRQVLREMEDRAATAALPMLEKFLNETDAAPYCMSPIASDSSWGRFVDKLPCYSGDAVCDLIPSLKDSSLASRPLMARL
jgi:acyl-CoA oxidase